MRFDLLFGILRSRFWLIVSVLAITTLTAVAGSLLMSKRYSATTTIHVDVDTVDSVSGNAVYSRETVRNNLATQIEIIRSDQVVGRVIKALGLDRDPDMQIEWLEATEGKGEISDWIAPMKDKVRPLLQAASKEYVSKDPAWPKRTEPCDKSS